MTNKLAIIGGSGLYDVEEFKDREFLDIKSSIINTVSFFSIESLWTSIVAVPYSNSKSVEYVSAGNLFFFLNIIKGFLINTQLQMQKQNL